MQKTLKFTEYIYINAIYAITEHKNLLMSSLAESLEQHDYLYNAVQTELDTPENSTIYKKPDHITGGLDEYPVTGINAEEILNEIEPDLTVILGVPHAVDVTKVPGETIAVTDGPRLVEPLRQMGFDNVVTELDAHSKTLGAKTIVESEVAQTIRGLLE